MQLSMRLALFLSALILGSILISGPAVPPEPLRTSLAHVLSDESYDLVFIGSSRFMRGVDPEIFDRTLAARGHSLRSFNLSTIGLREHEANAYAKRILARKPKRLQWFILETADWTPTLQQANRFSQRTIFWHEPRETLAVMRASVAIPAPILTRLDLAGAHALHAGARLIGVGRGWARWRDVFEDEQGSNDAEQGRGFQPYVPLNYTHGPTATSRRRYLAAVQGDADALQWDTVEVAVPPASHVVAELIHRTAEIQAAGVKAAHVALPRLKRPGRGSLALAQDDGLPVLEYDDPALHPEFYRVENRFDAEHLSLAGAEKFSELLAQDFAERFLEN